MIARGHPVLLLIVAVLAMLTAACSSSDEPGATTSTTRPIATTADESTSTSTSATTPTTADAPEPARPVTTRRQVSVDGATRTYLLTVPDPLPSGPVPLVVALHGGFGSGDQFRTTSHLDEAAAANGIVVAFPDGTVDEGATGIAALARSWNAGRCCGPARRLQEDDLAFFDALVADVAADHDVDAEHVLVTGHSNGAMMAFRLACERSEVVAAVAPVAGSVEVEQPCRPTRPPSVLAIHGDADQNHPIEGGRGARGVSGVDYRPLREGMDALAAAAGCQVEPTVATRGPETVTTWSGCDGGRAVEQRVVAGADHPWPGSTPQRVSTSLQGEPSQAIDATAEVVEFLLAHRT